MKKVRVDFSAHMCLVVEVQDGDDYLDRAVQLAEDYANDRGVKAYWEPDDDGADDADEGEDVDIKEEFYR